MSFSEDFKQTVRSWWTKVEELRASKPGSNKELIKKKAALLASAEGIRKAILLVPGLAKWLGLEEIEKDTLGMVHFVLPVLAATAITFTIASWLKKYKEYTASLDAVLALVEKGHSLNDAVNAVSKVKPNESVFSSIMPVALGIGALFFLKGN